MELMDVLAKRRSVRRYSEEQVPEEKLDDVLRAGLLAPSGQNKKPCEFYVVRDREKLKALAACKKAGSSMVAVCDTAIAVFADSALTDTWVEDGAVALTCMHLAAADLGVGSCWVQLHLRNNAAGEDAEQKARELFGLPASYRIVGLLALGMPVKEPAGRVLTEEDFARIHR